MQQISRRALFGAAPWFQDPARVATLPHNELDKRGPVIRAAGIQQG